MKKIVLLGDSLTAGWGLATNQNWSDKLIAAHPDIEFINCGVPGDTTTGMLSRFKQQVLDQAPDAVVLFGGLNDLNWGTDISVVASNLNAMIAQSQHHGIQPILIVTSAIDPVGSLPMFGNRKDTVEAIRSAIKQLSQKHVEKLKAMYSSGENGLEIVDIYQTFEQYACERGYASLYQADGIHLSPLGAQLIYNTLDKINW
ncbi:SGNH/GDSL hydrolase family protein [Vibrio sp. McD22-P3]|uniref:SGNH/GDSL hydrolase family protein n=1 Tax=Vibrio sp. McD22-P3 TaxID=2724880 RepID=UPI001F481BC3|nr:GDSL-type esterase/lipase family protein [Vibrio sp. McD22-P3]MCF4173641.1 GDSL-type esterase/lipase family protein [Vibrio sp. McD22-P3]